MAKRAILIVAIPLLLGACSIAPESKISKEILTAPVVIGNVCGFFPKEMVEKAVKRDIVRVESGEKGHPACHYFTEYAEAEVDDPEAGRASGRSIVVSYETVDPEKLKDDTKAEGNSWQRSMLIPVDNMIVRRAGGAIQQIFLFVDFDRVVRLQTQGEAVDGKTLIRLGSTLAERL